MQRLSTRQRTHLRLLLSVKRFKSHVPVGGGQAPVLDLEISDDARFLGAGEVLRELDLGVKVRRCLGVVMAHCYSLSAALDRKLNTLDWRLPQIGRRETRLIFYVQNRQRIHCLRLDTVARPNECLLVLDRQ